MSGIGTGAPYLETDLVLSVGVGIGDVYYEFSGDVTGTGILAEFDEIIARAGGPAVGTRFDEVPYAPPIGGIILIGEGRRKPPSLGADRVPGTVTIMWPARSNTILRSDYVLSNDPDRATPVVASTLGEDVMLSAHLRDIVGYRVYRSTEGTGFEPNNETNLVATELTLGPTATEYVDSFVDDNQTYYYKIAAVVTDVSQ